MLRKQLFRHDSGETVPALTNKAFQQDCFKYHRPKDWTIMRYDLQWRGSGNRRIRILEVARQGTLFQITVHVLADCLLAPERCDISE